MVFLFLVFLLPVGLAVAWATKMSLDDDVSKKQEKIIQKARTSIGESDKIRNQTLQMMRDWIQKQPHLSTCPTIPSATKKYGKRVVSLETQTRTTGAKSPRSYEL